MDRKERHEFSVTEWRVYHAAQSGAETYGAVADALPDIEPATVRRTRQRLISWAWVIPHPSERFRVRRPPAEGCGRFMGQNATPEEAEEVASAIARENSWRTLQILHLRNPQADVVDRIASVEGDTLRDVCGAIVKIWGSIERRGIQ